MRFVFPGLLSCAERKITVVTPSPLLAAIANQQFVASELAKGHASWESSLIYSLNAWLARCWQEARFATPGVPVLLSHAQEKFLWQQIIQREHPALLDLSGMAQIAMRAARIAADWHIPMRDEAWNEYEDASHFHYWHNEFRRICTQNNWATRADVWRLLPDWISQDAYRPGETVFAGFENVFPVLRSLIEFAPEVFRIETLENLAAPNCVAASRFENLAGEVEHAARWARAELEIYPSRSIAVLIPDLAKNRSLANYSFEQVFYPAAALQLAGKNAVVRRSRAFHIHAAKPLEKRPLIAGALLILELAALRMSVADAGSILRSPFLTGANQERSARASADVLLKRNRGLDVSLRELEWASRDCPLLKRVWLQVRQVLTERRDLGEFSHWSEFAGRLLKATGWPGGGQLTESEQELVDIWEDALADLSSLDLVSQPVTWETALRHLRDVLPMGDETGDWDSPVQVLDSTEAAGLHFDSAMICGLSDDCWPPSIEYGSPLIPVKLQRSCGVPGSTPQSARSERERLIRGLMRVAPVVSATYSNHLSPAAQAFVEIRASENSDSIWRGTTPWQAFRPAALEELDDSQGPCFVFQGVARGGTGLIKAQSQCPFRAFAEYRLRANAIEDGSLGMDPLARGTTLHRALELVWRELQTSARLQSMPESDLACLVKEAVQQAVRIDEGGGLQSVLGAVERERLQDLILEWLEVEGARTQPFAVEFVEEKRSVELAGLQMEVRLDRVDRLQNGRALLIDYKSGKQTKNRLLCPRPDEPQLLVYAASAGDDVDGIVLAQLQARDCRAAGFTREKQFERKTVDVKGRNWDQFLDEARQEVSLLAKQFRSGWAAVDPHNSACEFCRTKPLCRISENARVEREAE